MTAKGTTKSSSTDPDDGGVLRIGDTPEEPRYEPLIEVGGKPCDVLANPPATLLFGYLERQREQGSNAAFSWLLKKMTTPESHRLITENEAVKRTEVRDISSLVLRVLLGPPDVSLPKSSKTA